MKVVAASRIHEAISMLVSRHVLDMFINVVGGSAPQARVCSTWGCCWDEAMTFAACRTSWCCAQPGTKLSCMWAKLVRSLKCKNVHTLIACMDGARPEAGAKWADTTGSQLL